jgi:REP-associated tyrosine transposase
MARPLRIEFEDAIYHVCARGNTRCQIFRTDSDRDRFLQLLQYSADRFRAAVFCFVLMDNHFHLLVQTHQPNLSRWMHWLIVSYSVYFNRRYRRVGHLFQGRYKSFLVEEGAYLLGLSRYVHLNPARGARIGRGTPAERRNRLRNFKWSSYPGYAGLSKPFQFVSEAMVADEFGGTGRASRLRYRRFVEEQLIAGPENPFSKVEWQIAFGSDSFLQKIRARINSMQNDSHEFTPLRQAMNFPTPEAVLGKVARKFRVDRRRLLCRNQRTSEVTNIAIWMMAELCGVTLREIGQVFGGLDYAAVAQRIRRTRTRYSEKEATDLIRQMSNV